MVRKNDLLLDMLERIKHLEHEAELMRTVLIVKEPNTVQAAQSYEGLRKQIVAGAAERRSHLAQLVAISVAVSRATSVADLKPQVAEWMEQAGIATVSHVPEELTARDVFEDLSGEGLAGQIQVIEPAYFDSHTGALLRLGRAQKMPVKEPGTTEPTDNPTTQHVGSPQSEPQGPPADPDTEKDGAK